MTLIANFEINPTHESTQPSPVEFKFDLNGHELIDPVTNRGVVTSITKVESSIDNGETTNCDVYEVNVADPFVAADPIAYDLVSQHVANMEQEMYLRGFNPLEERNEATTKAEQNEYTLAWLADENVAGLSLWRDMVPTAEALGYLTNPWIGDQVTNPAGQSGIISPETAAHLRFVEDAIGIRNRGIAMQEIVEQHLSSEFEAGDKVKWLSLASGTAEPAIAAARNTSANHGIDVSLTVADWDGRALKYVSNNAKRLGFDGEITTLRTNILAEDIGEQLEKATGSDSQYDVVENMGFEEYLPQEGDELGACKGQTLPQASEFTRRAYDLVAPGGILISGNMVLDRPQIGFVFGIVDWPIINARSEESILRVYKEAGILDDPNAHVELFRINDATTGKRVYDIVKVTKLA